jgi:hypothetical protein
MGYRRIAYSILAGKSERKPILNGRIIIKWFVKKGDGDLDWIAVAQGRDRWRALVNLVINFRGP